MPRVPAADLGNGADVKVPSEKRASGRYGGGTVAVLLRDWVRRYKPLIINRFAGRSQQIGAITWQIAARMRQIGAMTEQFAAMVEQIAAMVEKVGQARAELA